jgi:ABC-type polar amino acid transport system ATPase subunit
VSAVRVRSVSMVRAGRTIVRDVSFEVADGELVALLGASGSGKTTILRALAGLDPIVAGAIDIGASRLGPGHLPRGAARRALHREVGIVFQFHNLFAHLTALENVCVAPVHVLGTPRAGAERDARALLASLGVEHRASAMPHELSGGEAQRVAIARALAVRPRVLLMDEPTASLDPDRRADLAATLRGLVGSGQSVVVATHDQDFVRAAADRRLMLREGSIVADDGTCDAAAGVS